MSEHKIELKVNGKQHVLTVGSNELLLNVLRDKLYLTGSKYGCGIAECGGLHSAGQWQEHALLPDTGGDGRRLGDHHSGGPG